MAATGSPDPGGVSAENFAKLVAAWEDDGIIVEGMRAVGIEEVLEQVFTQMSERIRPEATQDLQTTVQWEIDARDETHPYVLRIDHGEGSYEKGHAEDPRVTFRADVASFARLITGQANPFVLVATRKLRISGDLLFARKVPTFFRMPSA